MALRMGARSLMPALRRVAYRQARTVAPRQFSSSAHSASKSSDTPWMVSLWHPFLFVHFDLNSWHVLIDWVCTRLRPNGQTSDMCYVSLGQRIYNILRSYICFHLLRAPSHTRRTVLLVMASPMLPQRTPPHRLRPYL